MQESVSISVEKAMPVVRQKGMDLSKRPRIGEAIISFIKPNSLSRRRDIPLYRQVNRMVIEMTPAAINVM